MAEIPPTAWVPANTFAQRLRQLRHSLDMTVEEIAEHCGVPAPTWSTWENGRHPRKMHEVVRQIASRTHVHRDWLMYGEPPLGESRPNATELGKEAPIILGMSPNVRTLQHV